MQSLAPVPLAGTNSRTFHYSDVIDINYKVCGSGERGLLMLHGFGASLEGWEELRPLLEDRYTLYLMDLKGHGLSSKPEDFRYAPENQVDIVEAFIQALELKGLTLVGHSLGGLIALMTYLRLAADQRTSAIIQSLVLICSAAYPQHFPFFISALRTPFVNSSSLRWSSARFRARFTLRRILYDPEKATPDRVNRLARFWDLPGAHQALIQTARQIVPASFQEFIASLKTISVPTLIIWGREDRVLPLAIGRRLHHDIAGSRFTILEKCGHIPQEEQPEEVAGLMRGFLG